MLSKNKIRQIQSLSKKKDRDESSLFVAEGNKIVSDLLPLFACHTLVATDEFLFRHTEFMADEVVEATRDEIKKASLLCSPQSAIAIFRQPSYVPDWKCISDSLSLMLDTVQDPGNLGTIIRIADWFGIRDILCSADTVDVYNPKVVQATMGAIGRVRVHYGDLCRFIDALENRVPIFGTFLNGDDIYGKKLPKNGVVVMGNEGNGISPEVEKRITERLFIPSFQSGESRSESLNVAVATAITCSEFRRRTI